MSGGSGERLLSILDVFTEARLEWTPEELMAELGYSRPTLYRYLKLLREAGFLTATAQHGFTLGPRVVELDYLMRKSDRLVERAGGQLEALAARHPCSAFLVRWYGNKLLCVRSVSSLDDPPTSYPRGRPMPLARGAIARAILAFLPRRQQLPLIAANLDALRETGIGENAEEVIDSLRRIRRSGVAQARGEVTPGVVGIAAPVFDARRRPVAVLCVTLPEAHATQRRLRQVTDEVKTAAATVSMLQDAPAPKNTHTNGMMEQAQ